MSTDDKPKREFKHWKRFVSETPSMKKSSKRSAMGLCIGCGKSLQTSPDPTHEVSAQILVPICPISALPGLVDSGFGRYGVCSALFPRLITRPHEFAYRYEVESSLASRLEDLWQSFNAARRIGDAIVQYYDCSWDQILFNQPSDIPHWRAHGVIWVCGAQNACVAA
jgi:hypothetical protein